MMKNIEEESPGKISGVESAVDSLSYGAGTLLCGAMYEEIGVYSPILIGAALALLSLPLMFLAVKRMKKEYGETKTLFELLKEAGST